MQIARRPAGESDQEFVWGAYSSAYKEIVVRAFGAWDAGVQRVRFEEKWAHRGFEVVELDGQPVGAIWTTDEGAILRLREIFLLPERQGKGIGTRLVLQEIARARRSQKPLRLRVHRQNAAIALYARLGFSRCGETETHFWMEAV